MKIQSFPNRIGLPLAMQMVAILVCALIAAQLVTLALTIILPPSPAARWDMDDVVGALTSNRVAERLERKMMDGPPDVSGQGWLVSESSRDALARRLGRRSDDVVLAFYTQLPVGGVAVPAGSHSPLAVSSNGSGLPSMLVGTAQAQSIPGGPPPGGGPAPGGMPGGSFPGGMPPGGSMPRVPSMPPGSMPGSMRPRGPMMPGGRVPSGGPQVMPPATSSDTPGNIGSPPPVAAPVGQSPAGPGRQGPMVGGPRGPGVRSSGMSVLPPVPPTLRNAMPPAAAPATADEPASVAPSAYTPPPEPTGAVETPSVPAPVASPQVQATSNTSVVPARAAAAERPQPIPFRRTRATLFDVATPPFIEGDFIAAVRQADGRWLAVAPRAEPFPNSWQKRVMIWFLLSLAIVSPLAWLFVRRIVLPLREFAQAAEQLGRDPSATILPLSGPAEIGRAANAFNQMRNRLRAFVDDRTAMVGAISHDLRTPLTRLRFRIEDVPREQRDGLLREVTEMEQMISQVITFIRDASTPGPRERLDFAELVAGSVADARLVGADVEIESNLHIPVEVDPVGIRRLLGNLLENAVKYGERARVRVSLCGDEAIAEIVDTGAGIPEEEFDRAFEPFYRSEAARKSGQKGSGLGLAVCRSIARAHGGDVSFAHVRDGFVVRVSVPAAFGQPWRQAA